MLDQRVNWPKPFTGSSARLKGSDEFFKLGVTRSAPLNAVVIKRLVFSVRQCCAANSGVNQSSHPWHNIHIRVMGAALSPVAFAFQCKHNNFVEGWGFRSGDRQHVGSVSFAFVLPTFYRFRRDDAEIEQDNLSFTYQHF